MSGLQLYKLFKFGSSVPFHRSLYLVLSAHFILICLIIHSGSESPISIVISCNS